MNLPQPELEAIAAELHASAADALERWKLLSELYPQWYDAHPDLALALLRLAAIQRGTAAMWEGAATSAAVQDLITSVGGV